MVVNDLSPSNINVVSQKSIGADEVQLCAQALCLESMLNTVVPEGALFYGQTKRRLIVVFDAELRELTLDVIAKCRELLVTAKTPAPFTKIKNVIVVH